MTTPVASLSMYDHPAQHGANDALWAALRVTLAARGIDVPDRLDRERSPEAVWRDPSLVLAQACGYPLVTDPELDLRVVGVPTYSVSGCASGRHFSRIVVRRDDDRRRIADFRGARAAINASNSNTGYNLFRSAVAEWAAGAAMFAAVVETGSHRASVDSIVAGEADIAAIDAVTWAAIARFEPDALLGLRTLTQTPESPALPFVTGRATSRDTLAVLREALVSVVMDPSLQWVRETLFLERIMPTGVHRFIALRQLERKAVQAGYARLH